MQKIIHSGLDNHFMTRKEKLGHLHNFIIELGCRKKVTGCMRAGLIQTRGLEVVVGAEVAAFIPGVLEVPKWHKPAVRVS